MQAILQRTISLELGLNLNTISIPVSCSLSLLKRIIPCTIRFLNFENPLEERRNVKLLNLLLQRYPCIQRASVEPF
jgi:hypothetical protein